MRNAFEILDATPLDSGKKLQELFDEKQLLLDDSQELANAYAELTNPRKRIIHEIEYFAREVFEPFRGLFLNDPNEHKMVVDEVCTAIVDLGNWFDDDADIIIDEINDNREISGFPSIDDESAIAAAVNDLKANCVSAAIKSFDRVNEARAIKIFNALVKKEGFESFFVDELLAHYELKITDSVQAKQKECSTLFAEIERLSKAFFSGGSVSSIDSKCREFGKALREWDVFFQPLQVAHQNKGANHEISEDFVHGIRNRVIDLCNKSQETLTTLISTLQYSYSAKAQLPVKLAESIEFADIMLALLNLLGEVFAEMELTAAQLKQDAKAIASSKKELNEILQKIDPTGIKRKQTTTTTTISQGESYVGGYGSHGNSGGWWSNLDSRQKKKWVIGIVVGIIVLIFIIASIADANKPPFEGTLTSSNFSQAFSTSGSASTLGYVSYSINPKESGYSNCSRSSEKIVVTIKYTFRGGTGSGRTGSKEITLLKSNGYRASGSFEIYGYFTYESCTVTVSSVSSGAVYLD